ncbi:DUF3638 domain-containing protein [Candidatus Berkiella cookevillensis]|uniref:DUF3638 domain-containing protein n=1 Tax=Candidatus Berkiella cookevillensis TaxID=437022 RepID=A0A0Q9YHT3_9GAMM|nr:DUF3638 domain-containing protein [Candidatus Berkiella cookevillensis]MCS5708234.1 DUF3638 domain-containing protein [Candidatus Berkiella cookevillensis]
MSGQNYSAQVFAHIHNDPQLSGSPLEGCRFSETSNYLASILARLSNKELPSLFPNSKQSQKLTEFSARLNQYSARFKEFENINLEKNHLYKALNQFSKNILHDLDQYNSAFIPGGWSDPTSGGHAMLYELRKLSNNKMILLCWNSGAGINNHKQFDSKSGHKFSPVKAFEMPNTTNKKHLEEFISKLVEPRIVPLIDQNRKFNDNTVYNEILTHVALFNGKEVDSESFAPHTTLGQFSGTCTWAVLVEVLLNCCEDEQIFHNQYLNILYYSLAETLDYFKRNTLRQRDALLISMAKENLSRRLIAFDKKHPIPNSAKEKILETLVKTDTLLKAYNKETTLQIQNYDNTGLNNTHFLLENIPSDIGIQVSKHQNLDAYQTADFQKTVSRIKDINELSSLIEKAINQNETAFNRSFLQKQLESILLNIPLDADLSQLTTQEQDQLLGKIERLFNKYIDITRTTDSTAYSEHLIACYSAIAMIERILTARFYNRPDILSEIMGASSYCRHPLFKSTLAHPCFTIVDTQLIQRLNAIKQVFIHHQGIIRHYDQKENYIHKITRQNNALREESERARISSPSTEKTKPGLYFKENIDNPNFVKKHQQVYNDINVCITYDKIRYLTQKITNTGFRNLILQNKWDTLRIRNISTQEVEDSAVVFESEGSSDNKLNDDALFWFQVNASSLKQSLTADIPNENRIQAQFANHEVVNDLVKRILHLRVKADTQVIATHEMIQSEIEKLEDKNLQNILLALLFQSGFMLKEIENNAQAVDQLIKLIENGLKLNKKNNTYKQPFEFYIQLAIYLNRLLSTCDIQRSSKIKLQISTLNKILLQFQPNLDSILSKGLTKNLSKTELLNLNHFINIEIFQFHSLLIQNKSLDEVQIERLMSLLFARNHHSHTCCNDLLSFQVKNSILALQAYLNTQNINIPSVFRAIKQSTGTEILPNTITNKHPLYTSNRYDFNPITGDLLDKLDNKQGLPFELLNNINFKELFKAPITESKKIGNHSFEFKMLGNTYRVKQHLNAQTIDVFRDFPEGAQSHWYKYNKAPDFLFKENQLPHTLMNQSSMAWVHINYHNTHNEKMYIIHRDAKTPTYKYNNGTLSMVSSTTKEAWELVNTDGINNTVLENIYQFESKEFVEIWKNINSNQIEIRLPRYNIALKSIIEKDKMIFVDQQDTDSVLQIDNELPIGKLQCHLKFANKKNPSDTKFFFPRKKFYVDNVLIEDDIHYKLKYDTRNIYNAAIINEEENKDKETIIEYIPPFSVNFHGTESYLVAHKSNDKKQPLSCNTTIDTIHLAYLLLSQNKAKDALRLLRNIKTSFNGDFEQFEALNSILSEIPTLLINEKTAQKAVSNTPEKIATHAFVLSILASYFASGAKFKPLKGVELLSEYEKKIYNQKLRNLEDTIVKPKQFEKTAIGIYEQYLKNLKFIPKDMRLTTNENDALLSYLRTEMPTEQPAFLDIAQRKAKLNRWLKLKQQLSSAADQDFLSAQQKADQQYTIDMYANDTSKKKTKIIQKSLSEFSFNDENIRKSCSLISENNIESISIDTLSIYSSPMVIANNYRSLYQQACNNTEHEKKLIDFLEKMIASNANAPDNSKIAVYGTLVMMLKHKDIVNQVFNIKKDSHIHINVENQMRLISRYRLNAGLSCFYYLFSHCKLPIPKSSCIEQNIKSKQVQNIEKIKTAMPMPSIVHKTSSIKEILADCGLSHLTKEFSPITNSNSKNIFHALDKSEAFVETLVQEINADYQAGLAQNKATSQQNAYFISTLSNKNNIAKLNIQMTRSITIDIRQTEALEKKILELLNKKPSDQTKNANWQLNEHANNRHAFDMQDAFKLFLKQRKNSYQNHCNLNDTEITQVHNLILSYLTISTQLQQKKRAQDLIEKIETHKENQEELNKHLYQLGQILTTERCYDAAKQPEILVFEYLDNKLLYKKQFKMLEALLSKKDGKLQNVIIKLIMGGGKSKVLLPLLAKIKPKGDNLVFVEVPRELFETNFEDLKNTSKKIFGQEAYPFKFNRNMECDGKFFAHLKEHFLQIMANKQYIVTTRESIQSLELKLIEILSNPTQNLNDWITQIDHLSHIINMIKYRGDAILDEVDINLNPKDQIIYTAGSQNALEQYILDAQVELFDFMKEVTLTSSDNKKYNLFDIVSHQRSKPNEKIIDQLINQLAQSLINNTKSPIQAITRNCSKQQKNDVYAFLLGTNKKKSDFIEKLTEQDKSILSLYRAQIKDVLPIALKRNYNEHYGLPLDKSKSETEKLLAIPYSGAQSPSEYAKFKNILLALNYSTQIHHINDVHSSVFKIFINHFKNEMESENAINAQKADKTQYDYSTRDKFIHLLGIDLATFQRLDLDSEETVEALYLQHKKNQKLKSYCISQFILPNIVTHDVTIGQDAQNHVDMYRSTIGFTGTDYNYRTFHSSIMRDDTESFGTDGQTIDHLLRISSEYKAQKRQDIHTLKPKHTVFDIIRNHPKINDLRAIIDIGAEFKHWKNINIAHELADIFKSKGNKKIKYILYFNEEDILHALPIDGAHKHPIKVGSTDNIDQKLNCKADEYFSIYDQKRTTGTDIKQADNTLAIATISEKTTFRDLAQGCNRLRDLKGLHRVEYALMQDLQKAYPEIKDWNTEKLLNITVNYQAQILMNLHLQGAMQKINGLFRNHLVSQIRDTQSISQKIIYNDAFRNYIYETEISNLYEKYGTPEQMVSMKTMLDDYVIRVTKRWEQALKTASASIASAEKRKLLTVAKNIVFKEVNFCKKNIKTPLMGATESEVTTQKEVENEQENQQELALPRLNTKTYCSWKAVDMTTWKPNPSLVRKISNTTIHNRPTTKTLEQIAATHPVIRQWKFDANIHASNNFYDCADISDKLNQLKKPAYFVLMQYNGTDLQSTIITACEAAEIRKKAIIHNEKNTVWIETMSGIPYWGQCAKNIQTLISAHREQIHFFNADTSYLAANLSKKGWFTSHTLEKLDYLHDHLMRRHRSKNNMFNTLKRELVRHKILNPTALAQHSIRTKTNTNDRPLMHLNVEAINHKKMPDTEKVKLSAYIKAQNLVTAPIVRKWMRFIVLVSSFILMTAATIVSYIYRKSLLNIALHALRWIKALSYMQMTMYALPMISVAAIATRIFMQKYARKFYQNTHEIKKVTNTEEISALNVGADAVTWKGYAWSYLRASAYLHPLAYYRGLEIAQNKTDAPLKKQIRAKQH